MEEGRKDKDPLLIASTQSRNVIRGGRGHSREEMPHKDRRYVVASSLPQGQGGQCRIKVGSSDGAVSSPFVK